MVFATVKIAAGTLCVALLAAALHAQCPVKVIAVKGRVEHAPADAKVRVQLLYPKKQGGDSAESTLDGESFNIPIEFLTQSRRPRMNGLFEKCDRKPQEIVVTLIGSGQAQEYDHVSLDLTKDFTVADPTSYTPRSQIVLHGPQP